ncbi:MULTISPECIES: HD family phosphohydrolase [unclassified Coleofasciculus]|uniref:HD family phosphohydrolase n=1 Tax=unclassified Coleofasciculus TaxID=2692782 RepID=UPI001881E987|nr:MULTISPECIES: HD family phosphohydrolase [unclassified Coleofasciculus]MBE9125544.1 HD family phosphohydrolase [Coleofasciculus sp. LEGE 07081]MBE9147821.1 HD family phosphohydrolase [Coleofasciculus sp. LEGE 07092]
MKTLHSLTQPIAQLRRKSEQLRVWLSFRLLDSHAIHTDAKPPLSSQSQTPTADRTRQNRQPKLPPKPWRKRQGRSPVMWTLAVVSLTTVMGNRFYSQPKLDVGRAASQTIRAPYDASVEDTKTTEEKRKAARTGAFPVLRVDQSISQEINQNLQQSLDKIEEVRSLSGSFPFVQTAVLSDSTQRYLRQSQEWEWQGIVAFAKKDTSVNPFNPAVRLPEQGKKPLELGFVQAVNELQSYRRLSSPKAFSELIDAIARARQSYKRALRQLSELNTPESTLTNDASLLDLSDSLWQETRIGIAQAAKRILTQGIPPGLPPDIVKDAAKIQVSRLIPPEAESSATQVLASALQINLVEDKERTKRRAEQAAQAVEPVLVSVERGEIIVGAGEEITQTDFVLLDYFGLSHREINWIGLVGFGGLVSGAVGIFWLVERQVYPTLRRRDHILLLLLSLSTPVLVIFGVQYTDLPAVGLLVGTFYGSTLGGTVVTLLTGLVMFSMDMNREYLFAGAAGGLVGALMAGRMRSREELALLGGIVGLTQGVVNLTVNLIFSASAGTIWYAVLPGAIIYGLSGLAWSVVALGVSPYLERLFDLVTPIRLAELSNPNRSLLKRLATEAPGTFQHTLFVASLAEAAARELHCNVELVRAGTLYHDIGKMHDPLGFIENQMGGPNKHDKINDPWKSAGIIKKHVSEGLVMARKHQLPKAIRDFIPEHQGKLLISYFYFQAQQKAQQEGSQSVKEVDFRYDGPIPQSRETGIVMLADACEAALRSLKDVTPETALTTVNKIFKARWQDNQLLDAGLTREDLSTIAEVFVRVWQQYNHQRIAYPKAALNCQPAAK